MLDTLVAADFDAGAMENWGLITGRTGILVAHRLSTIADVDTIITLRDGCIDEIGSPEQLAVSGGIYSELLQLTASSSTSDRARLKKFGFKIDGYDQEENTEENPLT